MAKISSLLSLSIPEEIHVGDDMADITVLTSIEFHPIDIKFEMEYILHLLVYDIQGEMDAPIMMANWDETRIITVDHSGRLDDFLGDASMAAKAKFF